VILLEPRTPHQPEKLQKLLKNDCLFTPSIFGVNEKRRFLSALLSGECTPSTRGCQILVQQPLATRIGKRAKRGAARTYCACYTFEDWHTHCVYRGKSRV